MCDSGACCWYLLVQVISLDQLSFLLDLNETHLLWWPSPALSSPSLQKADPLNDVIFCVSPVTLLINCCQLPVQHLQLHAANQASLCQVQDELLEIRHLARRLPFWLIYDMNMTSHRILLLQQEYPNSSTILLPFTQLIAHKAVSVDVKSLYLTGGRDPAKLQLEHGVTQPSFTMCALGVSSGYVTKLVSIFISSSCSLKSCQPHCHYRSTPSEQCSGWQGWDWCRSKITRILKLLLEDKSSSNVLLGPWVIWAS